MSDTASSLADEFDSDDSESTSLWSSPAKQKQNIRPCVVGAGCVGVRPVAQPPPLGHKYNVIQKLGMRSTWGKVKTRTRAPEMRLFSRLPGRLAFFLRDVVPQSALTAGHVFLGFTGCGQFLLSYTQTTTDTDISDLNFNYYYRLHWWVFVPYAKAKKVAEVTLFTDQGVYGNLHISVCQWPSDLTRLVVHGCQTMDGENDNISSSVHCYLTVTNTPSLNNCKDCIKVASTYDADDVAEAWNSCVRLSCLRHGATVHTQYDLVPPYPAFVPKISLKREGCVVINTGNFLHSVTVDLETLGTNQDSSGDQQGSFNQENMTLRGINPLSSPFNPISVNVGMAEFSLGAGSPPGVFSPASFLQNSDSENTDVESESSYPTRSHRKLKSKRPLNFFETANNTPRPDNPLTREKKEKIQEFSDKLSPGDKKHLIRARGKEVLAVLSDETTGLSENSEGEESLDQPNEDSPNGAKHDRSNGATQDQHSGSNGNRHNRLEEGQSDGSNQNRPNETNPDRPSGSNDEIASGSNEVQSVDTGSFKFTVPSTPGTSEKKRKLADEAYDLTDDNFTHDDDVPDKLSTFRRNRLAEKKYEFTEDEEDDTNIFPITRLRSKKMCEKSSVLSRVLQSTSHQDPVLSRVLQSTSHQDPVLSRVLQSTSHQDPVLSRVLQSTSHQDLMVCVSERKLDGTIPGNRLEDKVNEDCWTDMLEGAAYPELFSPGGCIKKDANSMSPRLFNPLSPKVMSTALSPRAANPEYYCRSKFTRRYIEVDDELISVLSEVEDDDLGVNPGCYSALPLEVHGSGYTQMQMISNSKAERLQLECVRVQQRSLDLEHFCHETATRLCADADKKFWFCNDYDVEVIDVDPGTGDVVVVAVVLIQAAMITKSQSHKFNVSSLSRKQYQASFKFSWNIETGQYHVVDSDPLKEITGYHMDHGVQWNPAKVASAPLVKKFQCQSSSIKVLTNDSVIRGVSLKAIVDPDNLVALIMNDLE